MIWLLVLTGADNWVGPGDAPQHMGAANCNRNDGFLDFFYRKCRKNGELSLKNDDFVLKNGHSFCNSRYRLDPNGFAGEPNPQPRASFNSTVHLSNGGVFKAHRRERHQVLFDPQTHEPVALFNVDPQAIPATM